MRNLLYTKPKDQFFIFEPVQKFFLHIFEETPKISSLPFEEMQSQVKQAYETCNASLAVVPNVPTPDEQAAMTDVLQWGEEYTTPPKYQLEMYFDPQYRDSSFISCFNKTITDWVDHYTQMQREESLELLGCVLGAIAAVVILFFIGFAFCNKYGDQCCAQKSKREAAGMMLFQEKEKQKIDTSNTETKHLLKDIKHSAAPMNAEVSNKEDILFKL